MREAEGQAVVAIFRSPSWVSGLLPGLAPAVKGLEGAVDAPQNLVLYQGRHACGRLAALPSVLGQLRRLSTEVDTSPGQPPGITTLLQCGVVEVSRLDCRFSTGPASTL